MAVIFRTCGEECVKVTHFLFCVEGVRLVKKMTDWDPIGIRTKGQPKNRWRDEVKLRNWSQLIKESKAWNDLVQNTKIRVGL